MAHDPFISLMLDETFAPASAGRPSDNFEVRRELSKLGAAFVVGQVPAPGLLRFERQGQVLDLALAHAPLGVPLADPLVAALAAWLGSTVSDAIIHTALDGTPWLVLWDRANGELEEERLWGIFGASDVAQAA